MCCQSFSHELSVRHLYSKSCDSPLSTCPRPAACHQGGPPGLLSLWWQRYHCLQGCAGYLYHQQCWTQDLKGYNLSIICHVPSLTVLSMLNVNKNAALASSVDHVLHWPATILLCWHVQLAHASRKYWGCSPHNNSTHAHTICLKHAKDWTFS